MKSKINLDNSPINEEVPKLDNRVTKIQSDTQLRFSDLNLQMITQKKASLPGSSKLQDFGEVPDTRHQIYQSSKLSIL